MASSPETPKKRHKRRIATGLAAAGVAAAIGGYVTSHAGKPAALDAEQKPDTTAGAVIEVKTADERVAFQQDQTRFYVSQTANPDTATDEPESADSGPTDEETAKSIIDNVANELKKNFLPYDESFNERILATMRNTPERVQAMKAAERANTYYVERLDSPGSITLGRGNDFLVAYCSANVDNGTVDIAVHGSGDNSVKEEKLYGIEPYDVPQAIVDTQRMIDDYERALAELHYRHPAASPWVASSDAQAESEWEHIQDSYNRTLSEILSRYKH